MVVVDLDLVSVSAELSALPHPDIFITGVLGESPLGTLPDLLASGEFELSSSESLHHVGLIGVLSADRNQNLPNADASSNANGFSVTVSHSTGQPIGSSAGKHLIGPKNVEGVGPHPDVVTVLTDGLGKMLVDGYTSGLEGLRRDLLLLVADHVADEGEEINTGLLEPDIVDPDLTVGHTTAVP